uniref:Uncharacterized protein n=1 Tax=Lophocladia kuetzingii TaxID=675577 RepID=A0A1Z1MNF1_9FLOR|nr:hypothetical protein [Lophocladia kuetzingii]ARW67623.1 hypothetical protein [Lophocladia kuetzingii]
MTNKKKFFDNYKRLSGQWLVCKNIYFLDNKKYIFEQKKAYIETSKQDLYHENNQNNSQLNFINNIVIKINSTIQDKNFSYEEYLYFVNNNLLISIGLMKYLKNLQYVGITIRSYIKLIDTKKNI